MVPRHPLRRFAPLIVLAAIGSLVAGSLWTVGRNVAPETQIGHLDARTPILPDGGLRRGPFPGPYPAQLVRVVDGDTFEARVRVWFGQEVATLVRIRGIDAPELKSRCAREAQTAAQARDLLRDFLTSGEIRLRDVSADKYFGRVVASVEIVDGDAADDVAGLMMAAKLVRAYGGGQRASWCEAVTAMR